MKKRYMTEASVVGIGFVQHIIIATNPAQAMQKMEAAYKAKGVIVTDVMELVREEQA